MFKTIYNLIFMGTFIMEVIFFSTATAMVFIKPGISEILLIKISNILNPGAHTVSV